MVFGEILLINQGQGRSWGQTGSNNEQRSGPLSLHHSKLHKRKIPRDDFDFVSGKCQQSFIKTVKAVLIAFLS